MKRRRLSGARALRLLLLLIAGLAPRASAETAVRFEPSSLAFGELEVGVGSAPLSVTVRNTGGSGTGISFLADSPGLTVDGSDCGGRLAAGARCVVWVTVTPRVAGAFTGTLSAVLDDGTAELEVVGHGVVSEYPVTAGVLRGGGSIGPQRQVVDHGSDAVFTVTPDPGWKVAAVTGDTCAPARNGDGAWIAEGIVAPCAVEADFEIEDRGTTPGSRSRSPAP